MGDDSLAAFILEDLEHKTIYQDEIRHIILYG